MDNYNTEIYKRMIIENKLNNKNNIISVNKEETENDIKLGNDMGYYITDYVSGENQISFFRAMMNNYRAISIMFSIDDEEYEDGKHHFIIKIDNLDDYYSNPNKYYKMHIMIYIQRGSGNTMIEVNTELYFNYFQKCICKYENNEYRQISLEELEQYSVQAMIDGSNKTISIRTKVLM